MTRTEILTNLKGVFPPAVTPFNRKGGIDEKRFEENLRRYSGIGLGGVLVSGSTGEMPYLSAAERLRLVELARRIIRPPELLLVGTGLETTRGSLELSREAIKRGADVVLVVTPHYYKPRMDTQTLVTHYRTVADGLRRPLVIYNIPPFTGIRMEPRALATLARHPNIVGVKESSGDLEYVKQILKTVPRSFRVLSGSAKIYLASLAAGAAGGVLGQADFAPDLCIALDEAFRHGQMKQAQDFQARLLPLVEKISIPFGGPGIKAALDLCGYAGGNPRPPLLPASADQKRIIQGALKKSRAGLDF
jgi:4-hydroxy-2-oxoglutarate aldolase